MIRVRALRRVDRRGRPPFDFPAALAFAACVLVVGCGGDDGAGRETTTTTATTPDTTALSAREWRSAAEEGCARRNEEYSHLADAEPSTGEEAVEHTAEVEELAAALSDELSGIGLPRGDAAEARRLVGLSEDMAGATAELADAASSGDGERIDAATERIEELGAQLNSVAEELGVPACGGY